MLHVVPLATDVCSRSKNPKPDPPHSSPSSFPQTFSPTKGISLPFFGDSIKPSLWENVSNSQGLRRNLRNKVPLSEHRVLFSHCSLITRIRGQQCPVCLFLLCFLLEIQPWKQAVAVDLLFIDTCAKGSGESIFWTWRSSKSVVLFSFGRKYLGTAPEELGDRWAESQMFQSQHMQSCVHFPFF